MDVRRLAVAAVLVAALLVALFTSPVTRGLFLQKRPVVPAPAGTQAGGRGVPLQAQAPTRGEAPRLSQEELAAWRGRYAGAWRRDPFFTAEEEQALLDSKVVKAPSAPSPSAPLPAYTVKMVLISGSAKIAAIDGSLVSEGEMVGGERVVEIQPYAVVLERAGQRRRVEVSGGDVPLVEVGPRPYAKER